MIEQKNILLSEIKPDPNQPRKFYDETAMQELIDSVREKGILQPILVRPNGKGYILVCGERRFRAATAVMTLHKDRNSIPAVIREMSDDEALELQIIENLQRKDVHPMEEAVAFKSLIDKKHSAEEIAARVGKSPFYVRQRVKLNALSKEWQSLLYENRLTITTALKIAFFDDAIQKKLYEGNKNQRGSIEISDWDLRGYRGNLASATFPIDDATIDKKAGACTACAFNTASAKLFSETDESPRCLKVSCFTNKAGAYFNTSLEQALQDPAMLFVTEQYGSNYSDKFTERVKKAGYTIYSKNGYETPDKPDAPDFEEWREDNEDEIEGMSETAIRKQFEKDELVPYTKELKEYEEKISGGKYKKAFVIAGDEKGKIVFVQLKKNAGSTTPGSAARNKEKEAEGKLTAADIDDEIDRIKEREKRAKELDLEKIHAATLAALDERKEFDPIKPKVFPLQPIDRGIMIYLLLEAAGMTNDTIKGLPEPEFEGGYDEKYFEKLSKVSDDTLALVIRAVAHDKYGNRNLINGIDTEDTIMRLIARYIGINIPAIELAQNEIALNRQERVNKRIKQLQEKKKELTASSPAKKKAAKKSNP